MRRQRAAAGDRAAKLSADHVAQFLEHERIENVVRQRIDEHLEEAGYGETEGFKNGSSVHIEATTGEEESGGLVFARAMVSGAEESAADGGCRGHILENAVVEPLPQTRSGSHPVGTRFAEVVADGAEAGVIGAGAAADRDHFENALVAVPDRENGKDAIAGADIERQVARLRKHVVMGEHDTLRRSGGAGGVDDGEKIAAFDAGEAFFQRAVACGAEMTSAVHQFGELEHVGSSGRFALHEDDVFDLGQGGADGQDATQHVCVLRDEDDRVAVRDDERDFLFRGIGRARHVRSPAEQDRGIAEQPFRTVVRNNGHMLAGLESEPDQGRAERAGIIVERPVATRDEFTPAFAPRLGRKVAVRLGGKAVEVGDAMGTFVNAQVGQSLGHDRLRVTHVPSPGTVKKCARRRARTEKRFSCPTFPRLIARF